MAYYLFFITVGGATDRFEIGLMYKLDHLNTFLRSM